MSRDIAIHDIKFGDIDARSEILARDIGRRQLFLDSFYVPSTVPISELISGDKFLIVGPKGSGKTAFLRYMQHTLSVKTEGASRFIVFRDDVTAQDRDKLASMSQFRVYDNPTVEPTEEQWADCLSAWQIFIHREIVEAIESTPGLCAITPDIGNYIKIVRAFFSNFKTSGFKSMLQKITKGKVKIGAFGQGLEAEAEFVDKHGNLDVSEFARYCDACLRKLYFDETRADARINIFFDEVNITFVSGATFKRDAILIRDLIAACGKMNSFFAENKISIFIYTALRSEVVDSVEGSVRELQKWVDDWAVQIDWVLPSGDYDKQPIVELLRRRITANIKRLKGANEEVGKVDIYDYFESKIAGHSAAAFIVFETWGRPRDLVRMLTLAARHVGREDKFTSSAFEASFTEYSRSCWEEKHDELNSKYSQSEIESIKRVLTNFSSVFSRKEIEARISFSRNNDSRSNQFFSGRNVDVVLEDLFKVGVLGNILKTKFGKNRPTYLYMGHRNFDPHEIMCVHRSLFRELNLEALHARSEGALKAIGSTNTRANGRRPPKG